ncbi:MAG: YggS family pyridoxal phosphate-dependent enzyme [Siphonobacter sp.]
MSIAENLHYIQESLTTARLVTVTKTHPSKVLLEVYEAGARVFGENKVQEMVTKWEELPKDIEWHLIGHLQTNKVRNIVPFVSLIHSVDSLKLLQEIDKQAAKHKRVVECLLQIHIATEETKFGLSATEAESLLNWEGLNRHQNIRIIGLMGMATNTEDETQVRMEFRGLKQLYDRLKSIQRPNVAFRELSMGMSNDYRIAQQEGSTLVRVGSAIFGPREYAE